MENIDEVKQAEAHLHRAEAALEHAQRDEQAAQAAEQTAMHDIEQAVEELGAAEHHPREIHFTVDGEECETTKRELTPNEIIREFGKKDPATNYLVEIKGDHKISFQGKGDEKIKMHDCMNFQIVSTGPTPVSDLTGPAAFIEGLRGIGYEAQAFSDKPDHVLFNYRVETGSRFGQTVRLGFIVPQDFPNIPPGGPHVSPHIQAIHPSNDKPHPAGGVHQSPDFQRLAGGDWQYWSRPFQEWGQRKRTVTTYMGHIWRLWETQ
ncbi:MAG: hypothetical protein WB524_09675 [Acidobacteriaceae bacterium]